MLIIIILVWVMALIVAIRPQSRVSVALVGIFYLLTATFVGGLFGAILSNII